MSDLDKGKIVQIVGIFIIIIMAASMFAIGVLYNSGNSSSNNTPADTTPLTASKFNYSLSFDTNAIKDMGTIKLAAKTTATDKDAVDASVLKVTGVAKIIESSFMKDQSGGTGWYYIAKLSLKKGADPKTVSGSVFALSYFTSDQSSNDVRKYMTVAAKPIVIHNTDLNVDRDYNFDTTTLLAMTTLDTMPSDEITVGGTMVLQGTVVASIDLFENANITAESKFYSFSKVMKITSIDTNTPADSNIHWSATIDANTLFIPDLGKELPLPNGLFAADVNKTHVAGDDVNLLIQALVSRGTILGAMGKEQ